jgi:hypothetical protein
LLQQDKMKNVGITARRPQEPNQSLLATLLTPSPLISWQLCHLTHHLTQLFHLGFPQQKTGSISTKELSQKYHKTHYP